MVYTYLTLFLLGGFATAALGILVLLRAPKNIVNRTFALGMFALAIPEFANFATDISSDALIARFWAHIGLIGTCIIPATWTFITITFARRNYQELLKKWKWYLIAVCSISLLLLAFTVSNSLVESVEKDILGFKLIFSPLGRYFHIFLLVTLLVILANLEDTYRQSGNEERARVKYALLGLIGLFSFRVYVNSMRLLFGSVETDTLGAQSVTTLIAAGLIGYSILKHKLMDVDIYIKRQVVYSSVTILLAGIYLLTVGITVTVLQAIGSEFKVFFTSIGAFILLFLLLIVLLNEPIRKRITIFIDKNFYRHRYDYQEEWRKFSERTCSILDLPELLSKIIDLVTDTIYIDTASIMLFNEHNKEFYIAASKNLKNKNIKLKEDDSFIQWLKNYPEPLKIPPPPKNKELTKIYQANQKLFKNLNATICVPLIAKDKLIGIFNLGKKHLKEDFNLEDLELLKTIANHASVAITNAQLSEQLVISKEIESFHKVSSFILHDLKNSVSMLSMLLQNAAANFSNPEFQQDALQTISDSINKMKSLMTKLSTFPKKLELNLQPVNLNQLLQDTIIKSGLLKSPNIQVTENLNSPPDIIADYEYLQKVILNLILNAIEALPYDKGEIKIHSYQTSDFATIEIIDTGCGMTKEFINQHLFKPFKTTKKKGLGIGLYQCKAIIDAHNGTIEVESQQNQGTTIRIKLPIKQKVKEAL